VVFVFWGKGKGRGGKRYAEGEEQELCEEKEEREREREREREKCSREKRGTKEGGEKMVLIVSTVSALIQKEIEHYTQGGIKIV